MSAFWLGFVFRLLSVLAFLVNYTESVLDEPPTPDPEFASLFTEAPAVKPKPAAVTNSKLFQQVGSPTPSASTVRPVITSRSAPVSQPTITTPTPTLVFQACCGLGRCTSFDSMERMVGLQCCGTTAVNSFEKLCCNGVAVDRRVGNKYLDRCCGNKGYAWDQTCCAGQVVEGPNLSCCGSQAYNLYERTSMCCGSTLRSIRNGTISPACCGEQIYDASGGKQICCGGVVSETIAFDSCCVGVSTSPSLPPPATAFNSLTHFCCNTVQQIATPPIVSCCYTFTPSTTLGEPPRPTPVPYTVATQCCDVFTGRYAKTINVTYPAGICDPATAVPLAGR